MRKQSVLLALVEAVDLVDEKQRLAPVQAQPLPGFGHHRADLRHAAHDCRNGHDLRADALGEDAGKTCLAAARRSPEQDGPEPAVIYGAPDRASFADQRLVTDDLVERPRPHARGQRLALRRRREQRL